VVGVLPLREVLVPLVGEQHHRPVLQVGDELGAERGLEAGQVALDPGAARERQHLDLDGDIVFGLQPALQDLELQLADGGEAPFLPAQPLSITVRAIQLDGIPLHIVDTAGLRETEDVVEREGVRRALHALGGADHVLLIHDEAGADPALRLEIPAGIPITEVHNKIDLTGDAPRLVEDNGTAQVWLSAKTGAGVDLLVDHLKRVAGVEAAAEGAFTARTRHLEAIAEGRAHVESGLDQLVEARAGELLAEELRQAQMALGRITGEVSADDLLGDIFSSFCIGK